MNTMKKLSVVAMAMGLAVAAQATTYWAAVYSGAYEEKDTQPSTANAANYTAYLCTAEAAATQFGSSSDIATIVKGVSDYANWSTTFGAEGITEFSSASYDALNQYAFTQYFSGAIDTAKNYLTVLTYANGSDHAVRVFLNSSAETQTANMLVFDDTTAATDTVGKWTAVPEPTSALLMLFGLAGLALKRRA